jgi:hypothetical protein
MSQTIPIARLGLAAMLGTLAQGAAQAETVLSAEVLNQLSPQDRSAYVSRMISRQQSAPSQGGSDTTPPALTTFNAGTALNLGKAAAPFRISIKGTDDLSGIKSVNYSATGPSGQVISGATDTAFPSTSYSVLGGFAGVSQFLQPGTWKLTEASAFDWAGNLVNLGETALAALGNTTFTVSNSGGYDLVKPALTSGKLITASVSLSAVAKGTASEDPFAGVSVTAPDAGNTAVAGVQSAAAIFCQLADPSKCIYLTGLTTATGVGSVTLKLKSQVSAARGNVAGAHTLQSVTVRDHAGNFVTLTSTLFGGTTDFSTLFPATVITLKP